MVDAAERLLAAERDAIAARERLNDTVAELQDRLRPARLAQDVRREIKAAQSVASHEAKRRPAAVAGVASAALLVLVVRPLVKRWRRRRKARATAATSESFLTDGLWPDEQKD